jgi:type IV secretory pathway ATPase VirB11/archaellum biosynthesis ATPase
MKIPQRERAVATVTVTDSQGRSEAERTAVTLEELFDACRDSPPSRLVRVAILGPEGEVRLSFASFRRKGGV